MLLNSPGCAIFSKPKSPPFILPRFFVRGHCHLVPRGFILFDDYLACIRLINALFTRTVTLARHPCPALATKLFVPGLVGMVLARPSYSEQMGHFASISLI